MLMRKDQSPYCRQKNTILAVFLTTEVNDCILLLVGSFDFGAAFGLVTCGGSTG
jgi:hypothetical protein